VTEEASIAETIGGVRTPPVVSLKKQTMQYKILRSPHTYTGITRALEHYDGWRVPSKFELLRLINSPNFRVEGLFWSTCIHYGGYVERLGKRRCTGLSPQDAKGRVLLVR
jgi:hypothetical protein